MKKILILANSSGGLYDFRNELVLRLLKSYEVVVSLPDDVRTRELAEEGCRVIHTAINRRGVNPKEDISLLLSYRRLIQDEKPDRRSDRPLCHGKSFPDPHSICR